MTINPEQRRVRRLRLTAPAGDLFRRGEILLEDALRTASLPADRGRVLVVRSLNVGKIRGGRSSATLALAIEKALSALSAEAVHAAEPSAREQKAVYFRDDAEPYISLAAKIARREKTDAWFWPLAVRCWKPEMSRDEALRALLSAVSRTEAGARAAVAMVQELHGRRVSDQLFSALRWQDGAPLLQAFGWSRPSLPRFTPGDESPPEENPDALPSQCPARWKTALARWVDRWGADDARSLWLAAVVLATENPARLLSRSHIRRAQQLAYLARRPSETPPAPPPELTTGEGKSAPALSPRNRLEAAREPAEKSPDHIAPRETGKLPELTSQERPSELVPTSPCALESRGQEPGAEALREPSARAAERTTCESDTEGTSTSIVTPDDSDSPARSTPNARAGTERRSSEVRQVSEDAPQRETPALYDWPPRPRPSGYAGLFFLVPLMSRLGISPMLEANPSLVEIGLPQRLLHFVGRRLSIPGSDPALSFLSAEQTRPTSMHCGYSVPPSWLHKLSHEGPWTIRRMREAKGARVLFDGSGRLALGLWRGRMPPDARALAGGRTLKRGLTMPPETELGILCRTWLTALRRWCRRYAGVGLHSLVCRPGRVSLTPTHIDVLFDHQQSDIRIRKAGLDINPGWVAWLGRVVTYHYLYGEQSHGK